MISAVSTSDFRNLHNQEFEPAAGRNLLLGDNGSGKTSLLEALYLALTTRSFRAAQLGDCARHGATAFHVAAEVEQPSRSRLEVSWAEGRARHAVNGKASTPGQHLAASPVLAWTAAESELLTGAPELRRRFLDRALIGARPGALDVLSRYRRTLAQKRLVLAAGGGGVEPWNELLARTGVEVIRLRSAAVGELGSALAEVIAAAGLRFGGLEVRYRPSPADGESGERAIATRIAQLSGAERQRRAPLVGPHRDDIEFHWRGRELRRAVSAGERKSLGLALVAAQGIVLARAGRPPVFLLDDADAELDRDTLRRVWSAYPQGAQVLASSNRPEVWPEGGGERRWRLADGRLTTA